MATTPVREMAQVGVPWAATPVVRVKTAKVLLCDYGLVKKDFPFTQNWSNEKIDLWLLENTGYLAKTQADGGHGVNGAIPYDLALTRTAQRPEGYGRGIVYEMRTPEGTPVGLIDAKGTGAIQPSQASHASGLMSTGEGLREFFYEKYVAGVLEHSRSDWGTVGTYAVIDWGVDELHPDGSKVPAGSVLRQAHQRIQGKPGFQYLPPADSRSLELTLRRFGMTATGDSAAKGNGLAVNLQGSVDQKLVDFGQIIAAEAFDPVAVRNYGVGGMFVMIDPTDPDFVSAPAAEVKSFADQWGPYLGQAPDPKFDRIAGEMHDLARAFRDGKVTRREIARSSKACFEFQCGGASRPTQGRNAQSSGASVTQWGANGHGWS